LPGAVIAMAVHSIDYLNARRARMPAAGGTNYSRMANPVDQRARDAELDAGELLHEQVRLVFAEFRAWFAESTNALRSGSLDTEEGYVPF
jgi:hypothetical protein